MRPSALRRPPAVTNETLAAARRIRLQDLHSPFSTATARSMTAVVDDHVACDGQKLPQVPASTDRRQHRPSLYIRRRSPVFRLLSSRSGVRRLIWRSRTHPLWPRSCWRRDGCFMLRRVPRSRLPQHRASRRQRAKARRLQRQIRERWRGPGSPLASTGVRKPASRRRTGKVQRQQSAPVTLLADGECRSTLRAA